MGKSKFHLTCLIGSLIIFSSCGGGGGGGDSAANSSGCNAFRVLNGSQCSSDSLPVVSLELTSSAGRGICTGTIISNDTVLTAAHCAANLQSALAVHDRGTQFASAAIQNPLYSFDPIAFDIALITFPNIATNFGLSPARFQLTKRLSKGDVVKVVGYGQDGTSSLENGNPRGTELEVREIVPGISLTVFDDSNAGVCFGDSGAAITLNGSVVGTVHGGLNIRQPGSCAVGNVNIFTDMQTKGNVEFIKANEPNAVFE